MAYLQDTDAKVSGEQGQWPRLKLDHVQQAKWNETRTAVLWSQPAFADIWYSMMTDSKGETAWFTDQVPIAATDDHYLYLNPKTFFEYKLATRVFGCCHEILHCMFAHCTQLHHLSKKGVVKYADGKELPFDNETFQRSMDAVINAILVASNVGEIDPAFVLDKRIPADMSVLDAYRVMYVKQPPQPKSNKGDGGAKSQPTPGGKPGGYDEHLRPGQAEGKDENEAESGRNETEWRTAVAAAMASARMQGNLPGTLERLFGKLMTPEVDWTDLLRSALTRKLGVGGGSWEQLDPAMVIRGIGSPGRVSFGAGRIEVAVDTSGSITQSMMDRFMSEVGGIIDDVRPKRLVLTQCDYVVHERVECDDGADLQRKILGGGGTAFAPVFKRIAEEDDEPDVLVYFTDGYGSFPPNPGYPVIWANITKGISDSHYPFGEVVFVPLTNSKE